MYTDNRVYLAVIVRTILVAHRTTCACVRRLGMASTVSYRVKIVFEVAVIILLIYSPMSTDPIDKHQIQHVRSGSDPVGSDNTHE
jgi:hypothetical protein